MKIVAQNTPDDIRAREAAAEIKYRARELAASTLRIIAGAGNPSVYIGQVHFLSLALANEDAKRVLLESVCDIRDLDWRRDHPGYPEPSQESVERWERDGTADVERCLDSIVTAALRLVAAQLLAQASLESKARSDLHLALRQHREAHKEHLANVRASMSGQLKR